MKRLIVQMVSLLCFWALHAWLPLFRTGCFSEKLIQTGLISSFICFIINQLPINVIFSDLFQCFAAGYLHDDHDLVVAYPHQKCRYC